MASGDCVFRYKFPNGSLYFEQVEHSKSHRPDEGHFQCVAKVSSLGVLVSKKAKLSVACEYEYIILSV